MASPIMKRPNIPALVSLFVVALAAAGCSVNLDPSTEGDSGNTRFEYTGNGCLFGCGLDRHALQGSLVSITAHGGDAFVGATARLSGPAVGRIASQTQSCSTCDMDIEIEATQPGDAKLEIVDHAGKLLDSVTIHVRPAARIDVAVNGGARQADGVYEVKQRSQVKLGAKVFDAEGAELLFARHGVSHAYGDESVIKPDPTVVIGSTDVEDMIAGSHVGETTVRVSAPGAVNMVRFRVVP